MACNLEASWTFETKALKMKLLILIVAAVAGISAKYSGPTNQAGLNTIKEFEGWYPNFYTDPVGIKTIGYGHACHVSNCNVPLNGLYYPPLTSVQGEALLQSDLQNGNYESCVRNSVTYSALNANQYSALVSFTFNLGCGTLKSSTLLRLLNAGNVAGAANEFPKWVYAGGVTLPGLVRRRESERALFCSSGGCGSSGGSCIGTVTATSMFVRSSPSTSATTVVSLYQGDKITIQNRVTGSNVNGNSYWFKISNGYVSAYYINISTNSGDAWCSKN